MRIAALYHIEGRRACCTLGGGVLCHGVCAQALAQRLILMEVVDELIAEFRWQEEWLSRLERPSASICDLILGLPSGRARLAD
jgi:hypothetical protein